MIYLRLSHSRTSLLLLTSFEKKAPEAKTDFQSLRRDHPFCYKSLIYGLRQRVDFQSLRRDALLLL